MTIFPLGYNNDGQTGQDSYYGQDLNTSPESSSASTTQASLTTTAGSSLPCHPTTSPYSMGQCVRQSQIVAQCSGQRLSKSPDCMPDQFCCFLENQSTSQNSSTSVVCTPNTDPSVHDGACVTPNQLNSGTCKGQRLSKSSQCRPQDFCCFGGSSAYK